MHVLDQDAPLVAGMSFAMAVAQALETVKRSHFHDSAR